MTHSLSDRHDSDKDTSCNVKFDHGNDCTSQRENRGVFFSRNGEEKPHGGAASLEASAIIKGKLLAPLAMQGLIGPEKIEIPNRLDKISWKAMCQKSNVRTCGPQCAAKGEFWT